ncbi:MAG: hypothetical protein EOP21_14985, partial [Hyphomicrobiales bacterium]
MVAAPTLSITTGNGQNILNWTALTDVHYLVKRSASAAGPFEIIAPHVMGTTQYVDSTALPGVVYYYVVSAINDVGEGPDSAAVAAAPLGYAVLDRSGWIATASASAANQPASNALDANGATRWSTGAAQAVGQWFQVDMNSLKSINKVVLDAGASTGDYPRGYDVRISNDGINWTSVASGGGTTAVTTITFPPATGRYVRVVLTATLGPWWSVHELNIYGQSAELPSPWQHLDIGAVLAGNASYVDPVFSINGSGADIWGTADQFHYAYQISSGDCSVIAKVLSIDNTNAWAKSGAMIRETTAAGSIHAGIFVTPGAGVSFQ